MSSVAGKIPFLQDMPPVGGYGSINCSKKIPKGMSGAKIFKLFCLYTAFGLYLKSRVWNLSKELKLEINDSNIALEPLLKAEEDRQIMIIKRRNRDLENELMKNVPGWKTGTLWGVPVYHGTTPRKQLPEWSLELDAHAVPWMPRDRKEGLN